MDRDIMAFTETPVSKEDLLATIRRMQATPGRMESQSCWSGSTGCTICAVLDEYAPDCERDIAMYEPLFSIEPGVVRLAHVIRRSLDERAAAGFAERYFEALPVGAEYQGEELDHIFLWLFSDNGPLAQWAGRNYAAPKLMLTQQYLDGDGIMGSEWSAACDIARRHVYSLEDPVDRLVAMLVGISHQDDKVEECLQNAVEAAGLKAARQHYGDSVASASARAEAEASTWREIADRFITRVSESGTYRDVRPDESRSRFTAERQTGVESLDWIQMAGRIRSAARVLVSRSDLRKCTYRPITGQDSGEDTDLLASLKMAITGFEDHEGHAPGVSVYVQAGIDDCRILDVYGQSDECPTCLDAQGSWLVRLHPETDENTRLLETGEWAENSLWQTRDFLGVAVESMLDPLTAEGLEARIVRSEQNIRRAEKHLGRAVNALARLRALAGLPSGIDD